MDTNFRVEFYKITYDKFLTAGLIVLLTCSVNYILERKKAIDTSSIADAEVTVSKVGEVWEAIGEYELTLSQIDSLSRQNSLSHLFEGKEDKEILEEIESLKEESDKAKESVVQLVSKNKYYIDEAISSHLMQYIYLLNVLYESQERVRRMERLDKEIDLSFEHKNMEDTRKVLWSMRLNAFGVRKYAIEKSLP